MSQAGLTETYKFQPVDIWVLPNIVVDSSVLHPLRNHRKSRSRSFLRHSKERQYVGMAKKFPRDSFLIVPLCSCSQRQRVKRDRDGSKLLTRDAFFGSCKALISNTLTASSVSCWVHLNTFANPPPYWATLACMSGTSICIAVGGAL